MATANCNYDDLLRTIGLLSGYRTHGLGLTDEQSALINAFESAAHIDECYRLLDELRKANMQAAKNFNKAKP